mmetsp:Transcript_49226/g.145327  ORF Transcript_49226/g.145327 Transcript_49226/m.145327 type:complete len:234 (-) Transcript_49226:852-1553(-)
MLQLRVASVLLRHLVGIPTPTRRLAQGQRALEFAVPALRDALRQGDEVQQVGRHARQLPGLGPLPERPQHQVRLAVLRRHHPLDSHVGDRALHHNLGGVGRSVIPVELQLLGRRRLHVGDPELAREAGERVRHLLLRHRVRQRRREAQNLRRGRWRWHGRSSAEADILGLAAAVLGANRQRELPVGMVPQHVVHLIEDHQTEAAPPEERPVLLLRDHERFRSRHEHVEGARHG